jgi:threonine dehydratase
VADRERGTVERSDVLAAAARIAPLVDRSPLIRSFPLSRALGSDVWLKIESLHPPGSFKIRGAANKLLSLTESERRAGVVASSAGNHGAAVAHVAELLGIPATICVPLSVSPVKLEAIRRSGAEAIVSGTTFDEAVAVSRAIERELGLVYVHPFDDPEVIAGQGTIGLEILDSLPQVDLVVAALSGGGLIGGLGVALEPARPVVRLAGVSAERAAAMAASVRAGRPVDVPEEPTLAEVLSGGIGQDNRYTLSLVRRHVDDHVTVSEEEIAEAMRFALREHRLAIEGGGVVPIAAALASKLPPAGTMVLVVSGGNVDPAQLCGLVGG